MAYPYRNSVNNRDETQAGSYSNSTPRPSGAMANGNDSRGGLIRRFTTNALPTLSPIGQQRRQAAGESLMVSPSFKIAHLSQTPSGAGKAGGGGSSSPHGLSIGGGKNLTLLGELVHGSEPSPTFGKTTGRMTRHRRWKSSARAVGEKRPSSNGGNAAWESGNSSTSLYLLTKDPKSYGLQSRVVPSERRIRAIEQLLEQQRQISAELEKHDPQTRREVEEGLRHERAVSDMIAQSEPTTPPAEYQDTLPNVTARPNRYSTTSLTSPPGIVSRTSRSSTQLTSPPAGVTRPYTAATISTLPSQSVPGSRRQSDDEDEVDILFYDSTIHRRAANPNRNSMPVRTSYDRKRNAADLRSSIGPIGNSSFLFDEDEEPSALPAKSSNKTSPADTKTYLQVQHTADGFPKLIRREDNGELISGAPAALDLATNAEKQVAERTTASRHRVSLPPSALSSNGNIAPLNSILANSNSRRSVEVKFTAETKRPSLMASAASRMSNGMAKVQASYSTNDIPTLKSIDSESTGGVLISSPSAEPTTLAEIASQDHITSNLNRTNSISNSRQSQDLTVTSFHQNHEGFGTQSGLQGNAAPFGAMPQQDTTRTPFFSSSTMPWGEPAYYGGYGMQMVNNGVNNINLNGGYGVQGQWSNQTPQYQPIGYQGYQQFPQGGQVVAGAGRFPESRKIAYRQNQAQADEMYNTISIPNIKGEIYGLCKDQHGCRFLQRKLEERNEGDVQIMFEEVKDHFQELMIDPFGNYLCQRLLEYTDDEQRTALVENAAPAMTRIALNQHGTRALQRMIESISTHEQTNLVIEALRWDVVQLIQDLNGNHVIQKCLNHLSPQDAQFIFDAVGANVITVGTHRHGCCVLQRCVDHATGLQKGAMVDQVIANSFALVQDPFGNYVVQYVLDLSEPLFTEPLCRSFSGKISFLSKQKFSSNVIEKCMRCASMETRRLLISEIANQHELERLVRDSFANYVVQTAIDFADDETKMLLVANIRPIMSAIRNTPHGRRIQSKIADFEAGSAGATPPRSYSPVATPPGQAMPHPMAFTTNGNGRVAGRANRMGMIGAPPQWGGNGEPQQWVGSGPFSGPSNIGGFHGGEIAQPATQRSQPYNALNGSRTYPNFSFGNQAYQNQGGSAPAYGHF